jgi:hypothetical protein
VVMTVRETSLHKNPFWVLRVSPRDDRHRIVRQAEERSLEIEPDVCQKARSELTNPRARLRAEIAWLPGVSPKKAELLMARLAEDPMSIRSESGIPVLAHTNLLTAAFENIRPDITPADAAAFIHYIASNTALWSCDDIRRDLNEDRAVSGFPQILSNEQIEEDLANRKREIRQSIKDALNGFPTERLVIVMTQAVDDATVNGTTHSPELIDELVDNYETEAHEFLEKEADNVFELTEAARTLAKQNRSVREITDRLAAVARNWDKVAQPIQLSARARGMQHIPSNKLAYGIRGLAVDLFNEHDLIAESKQLTDLLRDVFAEVPQIAERIGEDSEALDSIIQERREWHRSITYRAEIGAVFKNTLSISPDGVSWKDRTYTLDSVTRVRWGGVRQSINGIPTGTTYTIAFGNDYSEAIVELRREEVFSEFLQKLWRAVCVRLLTEMLDRLNAGEELVFGDVQVRDDSIVLAKSKWFSPRERIRCCWADVTIWTADGSICFRSKQDAKVNAALSYIHVHNVHVLEHAVRLAFKNGCRKLSDIRNSK